MKPSQNVETKYVRLIYKYLWNRSFQHLHRSSFVLFLSRKQLRRVRYSGYLAVNVLGHVHRTFCFTDRNGQQKQNCESLKRMWRNFAHLTRPPYQSIAWRPTGMHCWIAQRHRWITCLFSTGNSAGQFPCVKTNQRKWRRLCFWISFKDQLCQTAKG